MGAQDVAAQVHGEGEGITHLKRQFDGQVDEVAPAEVAQVDGDVPEAPVARWLGGEVAQFDVAVFHRQAFVFQQPAGEVASLPGIRAGAQAAHPQAAVRFSHRRQAQSLQADAAGDQGAPA